MRKHNLARVPDSRFGRRYCKQRICHLAWQLIFIGVSLCMNIFGASTNVSHLSFFLSRTLTSFSNGPSILFYIWHHSFMKFILASIDPRKRDRVCKTSKKLTECKFNVAFVCWIWMASSEYHDTLKATNQRVVAAQRQQRGLVAVTIRGSVLFYSFAIWSPDFRSVKTEFRYLYGVDSIELRTLFYLWKMCRDHHWHWKNTKSKIESRRCQFCWYLTCILTIRLRDFFDHQKLER